MPKITISIHQFCRLCVGMLIWVIASAASASTFPDRPIRMLVGFSAGGTTDQLARLVAHELGKQLNQTVVVENRTGAGGNIAADVVARAKPDGYTIIMGAINHAINATLYPTLSYDQVRDFAPVSMVAITPNVLVVPADSPFESVADLSQFAKQNPGKLTFASSGVGTSVHLSGELFKSMLGADIVHVPYRGVAPAELDLVGGRVSMMFDSIYTALPLIKDKKLKALAVTSAKRADLLGDVPTVAESGLPGFDVSPWYSIFVPAGTPAEIVDQLNRATVSAMANSELIQKLKNLGTEPFTSTPKEADRYVREEIKKWAKLIRQSGAKAQ